MTGVTCGAGTVLTLPKHLGSSPVFSGVRFLVFCIMFYKSLFVLFHLAIVLSVLRFTACHYHFGFSNLFLQIQKVKYQLEGPVHNIRIWIAKTTLMTNEIKVRNNVTCVWISQAPTNKNATDMEAWMFMSHAWHKLWHSH